MSALPFVLAALVAVVVYVLVNVVFGKDFKCLSCGSVGRAKIKGFGDGLIELVVWALCIILAFAVAWPFVLVSILWTLIKFATQKNVCKACHSTNIIPLNSPHGGG